MTMPISYFTSLFVIHKHYMKEESNCNLRFLKIAKKGWELVEKMPKRYAGMQQI